MNYGKVILVGAGPGDIDLLTVKAKKYIEEADCIIYDRLVNKHFLDLTKIECEKIYVGKENHHHTLLQDKINELLFLKASEHKCVVRLKGGDPYVFGRGGEEVLYLLERGIKVDVVPGISSSIAALACAGIPITHRGLSKGFQVITAHSRKDEMAEIDYSILRDEDITLVFLMGLSHVGEIVRGLMTSGRNPKTPVAVISNGTTNHQKKVCGTLADIEQNVIESGIKSPAIIVVGKVVELADELNFFEKRPLFGKRFFLPIIESFDYSLTDRVVTGINELEKALEDAGADVVTLKSGTIFPVECDLSFLSNIKNGDYLIFTSVNGVKSFFWNLYEKNNFDSRALANASFAVVGEKTSQILNKFGFKADIIAKKHNGFELAKAINESAVDGAHLHLLCQVNVSDDLQLGLSDKFILEKHICYESVELNEQVSNEMLKAISTCDASIYTCASNVNYVHKYLSSVAPKESCSIGKSCTKALQRYGIEPVLEAETSSYAGIFESICKFY